MEITEKDISVLSPHDNDIIVIKIDADKISYDQAAELFDSVCTTLHALNLEKVGVILTPQNATLEVMSKDWLESFRNGIDELIKDKFDEDTKGESE